MTARKGAVQASFEELGTSLFDATFVVLDLETTGLSPSTDRITEVGAVKVRRGEVLGEFHALVAPGVPIPPAISALTGITDELVATCPPIEAIVPALLEFLRGAAVVAHNAHFDVSFLQAAFARLSYPPLDHPVVDTARLARRVLARDEVRNCKLETLAAYLRSRFVPEHRALADARATVDVFHGLLERIGNLGVATLEDLRDYTRSTSDPTYRKIGLVDGAAEAPGVYRFLDEHDRVLYVGKAANLRQRLRQYFGQDPRRKVADLVRRTHRVTWELTPTDLEAQVREVRAIHRHRPRFNRRSRHPERAVYVKLTHERFPRLSIVTQVRDDGCHYVGPLRSRKAADRFLEAVHDAIPLRQCTDRITLTKGRPPCVLKDIGRCGAPCDGSQDEDAYAEVVASYEAAVGDDPGAVLRPIRARMLTHAGAGRFEQAQRARGRLHHAAGVLGAARQLRALVDVEELVAARPDGDVTELALLRRGRLIATERLQAGPDGGAALADAAARLRRIAPEGPPAGLPAREEVEEIELVAAWLAKPGVRVVEVTGTYAEPLPGGADLHRTTREARRVARAVRRDRQLMSGAKVTRRATA